MVILEQTSLSALRQNHEAFFKFTAGLEYSTKQKLEDENIRLTKAQEQLSTKERELYEIYRKEQVLNKSKLFFNVTMV